MNKRNQRIQVVLNEKEYEKIKEKAEKEGMSMSMYLRKKGLK